MRMIELLVLNTLLCLCQSKVPSHTDYLAMLPVLNLRAQVVTQWIRSFQHGPVASPRQPETPSRMWGWGVLHVDTVGLKPPRQIGLTMTPSLVAAIILLLCHPSTGPQTNLGLWP